MAKQENETSLRDDILDAAGEVEEREDETSDAEQTTTETQTTQETQETVPGEAGEGAEPAAVEQQPGTDTPAEPAALNPPVDWAPEVAAKWGELTPDVQAAIAERERHVNQVLQESAGSRQAVETFEQMISPYQPLMQAEGVSDPLAAVSGLLQTTATLMMGTPQQKANKIANLVAHYGIDINMLDQALVGEPVGDPATNQLNQLLDQRLGPVNQLMQRVQQAEAAAAQQSQAEAATTIEQFAANSENRHFNQVRMAMADFLDFAQAHGQNMTIEEAYHKACMADSQVAPVFMQELTQKAAGGGQAASQAASRAASSVSGKPTGGMISGADGDMSLRDTIAAQFGGGGRI